MPAVRKIISAGAETIPAVRKIISAVAKTTSQMQRTISAAWEMTSAIAQTTSTTRDHFPAAAFFYEIRFIDEYDEIPESC